MANTTPCGLGDSIVFSNQNALKYIHIDACMYVHIYIHFFHAYIYIYIDYIYIDSIYTYLYIYRHYVCVCIYIYIYIYIYTLIPIHIIMSAAGTIFPLWWQRTFPLPVSDQRCQDHLWWCFPSCWRLGLFLVNPLPGSAMKLFWGWLSSKVLWGMVYNRIYHIYIYICICIRCISCRLVQSNYLPKWSKI